MLDIWQLRITGAKLHPNILLLTAAMTSHGWWWKGSREKRWEIEWWFDRHGWDVCGNKLIDLALNYNATWIMCVYLCTSAVCLCRWSWDFKWKQDYPCLVTNHWHDSTLYSLLYAFLQLFCISETQILGENTFFAPFMIHSYQWKILQIQA